MLADGGFFSRLGAGRCHLSALSANVNREERRSAPVRRFAVSNKYYYMSAGDPAVPRRTIDVRMARTMVGKFDFGPAAVTFHPAFIAWQAASAYKLPNGTQPFINIPMSSITGLEIDKESGELGIWCAYEFPFAALLADNYAPSAARENPESSIFFHISEDDHQNALAFGTLKAYVFDQDALRSLAVFVAPGNITGRKNKPASSSSRHLGGDGSSGASDRGRDVGRRKLDAMRLAKADEGDQATDSDQEIDFEEFLDRLPRVVKVSNEAALCPPPLHAHSAPPASDRALRCPKSVYAAGQRWSRLPR